MLHKCHISFQIELTEFSWFARRFIVSIERSQILPYADSCYRADKVSKGNSVSTKLARSSKENGQKIDLTKFARSAKEINSYQVHSTAKGFHRICSVNRVEMVNSGNYFWNSVYQVGSTIKGFHCFRELSLIVLCNDCS